MKIAVIGGGASGCMAAIMLAKQKHNVVLYEKNNAIGKKILITGKGRCNLTNNTTGSKFLENVVRGTKFLRGAEAKFNSQDTISFFENLGVKLKVERGERVFPVSDKSSEIVTAIYKELARLKVDVRLNSAVTEVLTENGQVAGVVVNNKPENFDAVIVATGGLSYKTTGSSGDGYNFAKQVGHTIIELKPALNGIKIKGTEPKQLEGLSLKNVTICAKLNNKIVSSSEIGEMLFTSVGISGPLVLTMSSYINRTKIDKISINFKPALSNEELNNRIEREIANGSTKQFASLLSSLLPKRLVSVFANRLKINLTTKLNQLTRSNRQALINLLTNFELDFDCVEEIDTSVITSGGVHLTEINPKDMQSKLMSGLFFIGEVLDIDALTGGFNLQCAFSCANSCASSDYFKGEN